MNHEEIQRNYKNHIFLSYRNTGGSKVLVGDVVVIVFFVNDSCSTWTEADKAAYITKHYSAMRMLMNAAKEKDVDLQIRNGFADETVYMNCTVDNYNKWSQLIIQRYGKNNILEYQKYYQTKYNCKEAPIFFVFNKPFRSYAVSTNAITCQYDELSVLSSTDSENAIIHELLHQFGARDLYYPQELDDLIQKMGYSSVMATVSSSNIDSLTAYLIGWTKEINYSGVQILEKMKHYTFASLIEETQKEWKKSYP